MPRLKKNIFFLIASMATLFSCKTVKPYQRVYLNDDAMQAGKRPIDKLPDATHNYREGASGGGSGSSSGGCSCN